MDHILYSVFNLIVSEVSKLIFWCCLLDVGHRNVGKWVTRPRSRSDSAYLSLSGRGRVACNIDVAAIFDFMTVEHWVEIVPLR